ncbi:glycoside hydrolase family 2 TIM barrel-domain containing protein [Microbacterium sp. ARD31]|uniref:glycoside hydrolase family 2 TIM barrel-domain containing protein n=1 Tax=Microbacterium sp. ARD31 TaxID=2962576 RepID=UPI0028824525|nr:glycoside hydrolase family 2 TIM barrel-domain containing protein [Microbacterium sp. ARD31]MDT0184020.1 glycoside hydrolase family 2 TIM barrel-domain containing protein [Microbacterium sp. ARD31]
MLREPFNDDWYVAKLSPEPTGVHIGPVSVPYDAMMFEQRDPDTVGGHTTGYFPGGVYRYLKTFRPTEGWRGKSVLVEFEGIFHRSEVRLNGQLIGGRPSGYTLFHVELADHLEFGVDNILEVVARNDDQPNSRWYTGSGIYRPVNLVIGGPVRITPTGLRVSTVSVEAGAAVVEISTEVVNSQSSSRTVTLSARVNDPLGDAVTIDEREVDLAGGGTTSVTQTIHVADADLWSPDHPALYLAHMEVRADGEVLDTDTVLFGIRTVSIDSKKGLCINGVPTKLRGAAIHHDNGVIGAHTLEAAEERRVRILKESGYNAIRSAHNPISTALLRACDRHGMLVMDELTDSWWRPMMPYDYGRDFPEWWERDLAAMIAKDFNHPSVILYSLGNEIPETGSAAGVEQSKKMVALVRELDATRFTTNAINGFVNLLAPQNDKKLAEKEKKADEKDRDKGEGNAVLIANLLVGAIEKVMHMVARLPAVDKKTRDIFDTLDVAGYNYMHRRYEMDGRAYPERVIVGTETQPSQTAEIWRDIEHLPHVIGDFVWTGWDYIGEVGIASPRYNDRRRLYLPYPGLLAGEPIIDITGHRQTQSYVNQIIWHQTRGPHIAVRPVNHSGKKRVKGGWRVSDSIRSWSWEGLEGTPATVEVYADAARVELLLNGQQVGSHTLDIQDHWRATFTIPYMPGQLTSIAYAADGSEIGRDTLASAGDSLQLRAKAEVSDLRADGADLAYIPIELTDDAGTIRPLADREITVTVSGAGSLLGLGSANPTTEEGFASNRHATYYGRALAVIRAALTPGDIIVAVRAEGCEEVIVTIPARNAGTPTASRASGFPVRR